ncbi:hypothetical protein V5799_013962 [Amblyomma americanum]|uniref:Uncharacterized protein n=1 Tax=Amblyomma americanum TaxID=6943 RepID=A0AAQ4E4E9_AMBAM
MDHLYMEKEISKYICAVCAFTDLTGIAIVNGNFQLWLLLGSCACDRGGGGVSPLRGLSLGAFHEDRGTPRSFAA